MDHSAPAGARPLPPIGAEGGAVVSSPHAAELSGGFFSLGTVSMGSPWRSEIVCVSDLTRAFSQDVLCCHAESMHDGVMHLVIDVVPVN